MSKRHASPDSDVILGAELRRKLNSMSKQRFYFMVKAGRFQHLEAVGPSSVLGYTVYSRRLVQEWIDGGAAAAATGRPAGRVGEREASARVQTAPEASLRGIREHDGKEIRMINRRRV